MLRFEFTWLTDLDARTRRIMIRRMTWVSGSMRDWLRDHRRNMRLCLLYNSHLATWVSMDSAKYVGAWTTEQYRKRGFAQAALWALINERRKPWGITRNTHFSVYHTTMGKVVRRLGYKIKRKNNQNFF